MYAASDQKRPADKSQREELVGIKLPEIVKKLRHQRPEADQRDQGENGGRERAGGHGGEVLSFKFVSFKFALPREERGIVVSTVPTQGVVAQR